MKRSTFLALIPGAFLIPEILKEEEKGEEIIAKQYTIEGPSGVTITLPKPSHGMSFTFRAGKDSLTVIKNG